jgi:hypothetical protein
MNTDQFSRSGISGGGPGVSGSRSSLGQGSQGTSQPTGQGARQSGAFDEIRERAGEGLSRFTDAAQEAAEQAKQTASSLAAEANQKAKGMLNQQIETGADVVQQVAGAARAAADNLDRTSPQLAQLVRGAADRVEGFSRDLRGQSIDDVWRTASDFTRRQPALVFALASLAGFLAFRVLKAGQSNVGSAYRQYEPDSDFRSQREQFGQRASEFHGA